MRRPGAPHEKRLLVRQQAIHRASTHSDLCQSLIAFLSMHPMASFGIHDDRFLPGLTRLVDQRIKYSSDEEWFFPFCVPDNVALVQQIIALEAELSALEADISRQEGEMNTFINGLYSLNNSEVRLITKG